MKTAAKDFVVKVLIKELQILFYRMLSHAQVINRLVFIVSQKIEWILSVNDERAMFPLEMMGLNLGVTTNKFIVMSCNGR